MTTTRLGTFEDSTHSQRELDRQSTHSRQAAALGIGAMAVFLASIRVGTSVPVSAAVALVIGVGCAVVLGKFQGVGSLPVMYAIVFALFHFGTTPELLLGGEEMLRTARFAFLNSPNASRAFEFAAVGLLSFTAIAIFQTSHPSHASERSERIARFGHWLMCASLLGYFALLTAELGPAWILRPYNDYSQIRSTLPAGWPVFGLGLGVVLASTSRDSKRFRNTMLVFCSAGSLLALFGLRERFSSQPPVLLGCGCI